MGLYFFGFYGGADGKALIILGVLVPHFVPRVGLYSIAPLIILTNGVSRLHPSPDWAASL